MGGEETKNDCADPSSDEAFDGLLWAKLDQLGTAEGDPAKISKNIVAALKPK